MIQSIETGRKEDGNRSIADKIIKRLHDLEKTVVNNHGRWAWELLQNAKDSVADTDRNVSVRLIYQPGKIEFQHNGGYFTEKDIRGLINQISSKEVEEGEQSTRTGRFGTGFLTTHLLSKVIQIKGIVKTVSDQYFEFNFPLDRDGKTTGALVPKIERAWQEFHASTEQNELELFDINGFNTSFVYPLASADQQRIAETGVDEFVNLLPYVLAFVPAISYVEIIDEVRYSTVSFTNSNSGSDGLRNILKKENGNGSSLKLLYRSDNTVSVAVQVSENNGKYCVKDIKDIPKLFCDFPLIGTENFHFPIIVNSFYFSPQTERDGIWLQAGNDDEVFENKDLLEKALDLYQDLINDLNGKPFECLYNVSRTQMPAVDEKYFDIDWYKSHIQTRLREFLLKQPIVTLEDGEKSLLGDIWFPLKGYSVDIRNKLWQFTYDLYSSAVCKLDDLPQWTDITWDGLHKLTYGELISDLANHENMEKLETQLDQDDAKTFDWYNKALKFIVEEDANLPLLDKHAIIPNKNGIFLLKEQLYIDKIRDDSLLEILDLLGKDWKGILLHDSVRYGKYFSKEKKDIAHEITAALKNISKENPNAIKAISMLSEWFDYHPEEGAELFSENYRNRAELFLNTIEDKDSLYKIMRSKTSLSDLTKVATMMEQDPQLANNIDLTKDLLSLIKRYNLNDLAELEGLLSRANQPARNELLPVTQEILVNMGITSVDEWQAAIEDKDLAALFSHTSTPSTDMFVYAQSLIKKAKDAIIAHLETLSTYNLDNLDTTTAPTILAGVLKDGKPISIVARPAYNGQVIIYYGSERDILDYEPSELWVDDNVMPRAITLGHLLKVARIVKFPI